MNILPEYAAERLKICGSCDDYNSTIKTCKVCGCLMPAKVLIKQGKCPVDKWTKLDKNSAGHNEDYIPPSTPQNVPPSV